MRDIQYTLARDDLTVRQRTVPIFLRRWQVPNREPYTSIRLGSPTLTSPTPDNDHNDAAMSETLRLIEQKCPKTDRYDRIDAGIKRLETTLGRRHETTPRRIDPRHEGPDRVCRSGPSRIGSG